MSFDVGQVGVEIRWEEVFYMSSNGSIYYEFLVWNICVVNNRYDGVLFLEGSSERVQVIIVGFNDFYLMIDRKRSVIMCKDLDLKFI